MKDFSLYHRQFDRDSMNILLVTMHPVGGIRTYLYYVYSHPCFEDVHFTLIAPDKDLSSYLVKSGLSRRIEFVPVHNRLLSLCNKTRQLLSNNTFDLMHSHGFTAGIMCELARIGVDIKHLMTAHDIFLSRQFQGFKGKSKKAILKHFFQKIDHINTVSDDARDNFLKYFPDIEQDKIFTIQNGIHTEEYAAAESTNLRERLGINQSRPLIGFFGRFMAQKGFRYLVDAIGLLSKKIDNESMPLIVTFGWGGFIREDYQYLNNKGLSPYFIQLPHADDMPSMLKSVDFVVIPSLWEACALLPMEVLAAGTPLIATDCIGMREIVRDTPTKVISPASPQELASAIEQYLNDLPSEKFQAFAPKARQLFSSETTSMTLYETYGALTTATREDNLVV